MLCGASYTWAEPQRTITVKGMQTLLNENPAGYHAKQEKNISTGQLEWVVTCDETPLELKVLEGPLSYYLNMGVAQPVEAEDSIRLVLDPNMSPFILQAGFGQLANDLHKEAIRNRDQQQKQTQVMTGLTSSQDALMSQIGRLDSLTLAGGCGLLLIIGALSYGFLREIKSIKYIRSGQADKDAHAKTVNQVNTALTKLGQSNQQALDQTKLELGNRLKLLEGKFSAFASMAVAQAPTNGTSKSKEVVVPTEPKVEQPLPPMWDSSVAVPVPQTETEDESYPAMSSPVRSILDQLSAAAEEGTSTATNGKKRKDVVSSN